MSGVVTARKKPVVIQALWFDGENVGEVLQFIGTADVVVGHDRDTSYLLIWTLEGEMRADVGDWIIRGTRGEFYPCKAGPFEDTFDIIGERPA